MTFIDILIIAVSVTLVVFIIIDIVQAHDEKEALRLEEQKKREELRAKAIKQAEEEYTAAISELENKYGKITTSFLLGFNDKKTSHYIYFFEDKEVISLSDEIIHFKDILEFTLNDDTKTIMTNSTYISETKTNTGSLLGRAAVGGILLGGVGAIAGASSAKQTTTTTPMGVTTTTQLHKYTIYLNINDLANPIREIPIGSDTKKAQTIANIFNVILNRNKSQQ